MICSIKLNDTAASYRTQGHDATTFNQPKVSYLNNNTAKVHAVSAALGMFLSIATSNCDVWHPIQHSVEAILFPYHNKYKEFVFMWEYLLYFLAVLHQIHIVIESDKYHK